MRCLDDHLFQDDYLRNNKNSGQKNVRCFPSCSKGGHNKQRVRRTVELSHTLSVSRVFVIHNSPADHAPPFTAVFARSTYTTLSSPVLRPSCDVRCAPSAWSGTLPEPGLRGVRGHSRGHRLRFAYAAQSRLRVARRGRSLAGRHPCWLPHSQRDYAATDPRHIPGGGLYADRRRRQGAACRLQRKLGTSRMALPLVSEVSSGFVRIEVNVSRGAGAAHASIVLAYTRYTQVHALLL